jgi:hypothetical protein
MRAALGEIGIGMGITHDVKKNKKASKNGAATELFPLMN